MTRVTKNELERVFFSFFGHTKNLALQAYFSPHYQKSPFGPKKLLGWARRKTRGVWPLKGQEVGEQNWVYYELGGGLERPFCPGCHTNSEVKTAFAHPSSSPRNANTFFFLIRCRKLEYQAVIWRSLHWSKFIAHVVVVEWGCRTVYWSRGGPGARSWVLVHTPCT